MALTDEDFDKLGSLRGMRVFAATIQEIVNDPSRDNDSFEDKIKEALEAQLTARDNKVIQTRLREAKLLGSTAALERFDAYPGRGVTQDRIDRLATCEWIDYGKDLIIVGATGTGKSFLAQALAVAACRKKLTARYYRLNDLANDFDAAAEHPQARKQLLADLQAPALIVIDDFLATDVSAHALNQVFNLLVGREHASTVIASQHEPDYWYDVFSEAALADAVMSRLANHGSKLTLTGEDMRTRDDIKQERMGPTTPTRLRQPRKS